MDEQTIGEAPGLLQVAGRQLLLLAMAAVA